MPSSSRSRAELAGVRLEVAQRAPDELGDRNAVAAAGDEVHHGRVRPCRAASHLFSVVRIRWKLGAVPTDSTCSQSSFTSAWK